jgi:hypothetical protein
MEYDRRGIKFDDNDYPIELAKKEGADELFIKDMEYRKTMVVNMKEQTLDKEGEED